MTICLDVDGVLADFPRAALHWINGYSPLRAVKLEHIDQHDILEALGLGALQESFDSWCRDTELCRSLPVYDGAKDFVRELRAMADVLIVTSPYSAVPNWCHHRINWLAEHFGISKRDVIFAKRKDMVRGHLLIDDKLSNCEAWVSKSAHRKAVVFDQPWNRQQTAAHGGNLVRARSYEEVLKVVRESLG